MPEDDKSKGAVGPDEQEQEPSEPRAEEKPEESAAESAGEAVGIEALQEELGEQRELVKHHLDQWKRSAADLENYRKRVQKEREELVQFGNAALIGQLLPTLDDLDRALQTVPAALNQMTWVQGVGLIERKLRLVLEQQGLKEIEALGKTFDPLRHEAVMQEDNDAYPDGQVIAVLQKGYALHDRVLRPAMVKVAKNKGGGATRPSGDAEVEEGSSASSERDKSEEE